MTLGKLSARSASVWLRDEEVRVREDAVEVLVGDGRLRRGEIDRVPAEGLGDLVGVQPPVLPDAGLELRSCRTQGRRAANGRYVSLSRYRPLLPVSDPS